MTYVDEEKKPRVLGTGNLVAALAVHIALFVALWIFGELSLAEKKLVIPVELTVVVDAPPPLAPKEEKKPAEKKPTPREEKPVPPKEVKAADAVEKIPVKTNAVARVRPPEIKPPEERKKPDVPQKTAAQLREERLREMRERARNVVVDAKSAETKEKPPVNWEKLLELGYRPGATNQIAPNEESRCLGLLKSAIDEKWRELSPQTGAPGTVHITIKFAKGGSIASSSLSKGSGDTLSDAAAMKVVRSVGSVRGLSSSFLDKYSKEPITIRYRIGSSAER
ncbi:MAG: TonB family protein [Kiritimatiellae bacterium]|nr:TonB family protein [Kiritimatiellia bacterium]